MSHIDLNKAGSPMEKYQLLLPEDDEHCVSELGHLGEGEEPGPEAAHFV